MKNLALFMLGILILLICMTSVYSQENQGWFPLMKGIAKGKELPRAFGVGVNWYSQNQDYSLTESAVYAYGFKQSLPEDLEIENRTVEMNLKMDLWLLPFLNIFGILGSVDGETTVYVDFIDDEIIMDYEGTVYGYGVTIAAGSEKVFGSLTTTITDNNIKTSESSVKALILSPKAGVLFKGRKLWEALILWVGAMYQEMDERHQGTFSIPNFMTVDYDVTLQEKSPWNYLAGMSVNFSKRIHMELEGGTGKRKHAMASLVYRM
jgi:hypothetical protein